MTQTHTGILLAVIALFGWGFSDFFAQKTTKKIGVWKSVFLIGFAGFIILLPVVWNDLPKVGLGSYILLSLLAVVALFAALFNYEALQKGKLAIVEPLCGLELPLTVALSVAIGKEHLTGPQVLFIGIILVGIVAAVTIDHSHLKYHKRMLEKGVAFAGLGVVGMALTNFLVGTSSQQLSPLVTIWFMHTTLAVICGLYLHRRGDFPSLLTDLKKYPIPLLGQSILNNVAWIGFALSTTIITISVATAISESYIALGVLLGIFVNREKLLRHQVVGVILAVIGIILLSLLTP